MDQERTQTVTQADYGLVSKASQPSHLAQLLDAQEKTQHLLQILAEKLSPVANPHPVDSAKLAGDRGYHIETALYRQREINEGLSYLTDTLVV